MKIALVHDFLSQNGGAEQVLLELHRMFPKAPIYCLFADRARFPQFAEAEIHESFIAHLPWGRTHYQWYLPLMPRATESYDLSGYDLVISSTSAFAKGIITRPDAIHICYCHTPTRYLWSDARTYVEGLSKNRLIKMVLPYVLDHIRVWDRMAADRPTTMIANSKTIAARIKKYYDRESTVIYPPIDTAAFAISAQPKNYFLAGGRLVSYKKFDQIVEAFNRLKLPLKIFGEGPLEKKLKAAAGSNIEFLGRVPLEMQRELYANCIAYIQPQLEDFGMTAVEAMASGRPVIALSEGGSTETVLPGVTGEFMRYDGWEGIFDAVLNFDETRYDSAQIRAHAETFSRTVFQEKIRAILPPHVND